MLRQFSAKGWPSVGLFISSCGAQVGSVFSFSSQEYDMIRVLTRNGPA